MDHEALDGAGQQIGMYAHFCHDRNLRHKRLAVKRRLAAFASRAADLLSRRRHRVGRKIMHVIAALHARLNPSASQICAQDQRPKL
jgi:hypothetical protein